MADRNAHWWIQIFNPPLSYSRVADIKSNFQIVLKHVHVQYHAHSEMLAAENEDGRSHNNIKTNLAIRLI
jgi:hypothetical protein